MWLPALTSPKTQIKKLYENLASAELATFPKGRAKVPALASGAKQLEGDVSSSSYIGEGLRGGEGAHWPPGAQGEVSQQVFRGDMQSQLLAQSFSGYGRCAFIFLKDKGHGDSLSPVPSFTGHY